MRTQRMILGLAMAGGLCILAGPAFSQGTPEQQMACTPDVWRLCGAAIPDVDRIVACLRQNTPQLSEACRAVFVTSNDPPPAGIPRQRAARQQRAERSRAAQRRRDEEEEAVQRRYDEEGNE